MSFTTPGSAIVVTAMVTVRWEEDPNVGPGTVWVADYSSEPLRRDGEADGLLGIDEIRTKVVAAHSASA